jgi:hypothetical protein
MRSSNRPLAQALRYVQHDLPGLTEEDRAKILGTVPKTLFGFTA